MTKKPQTQSVSSSQIVNDLLEALPKELFKERIISIIQFGSSIANESYGDIDLYILLNSYEAKDLITFRKLKRSFPSVDFALQWSTEFNTDPDQYILGHQGAYLAECLATAKVLYGKNPFTIQSSLTQKQRLDIVRKMQEYVLRLDLLYLEAKKIKGIKSIFNKYVCRILFDACLYLQVINFNDMHYLERTHLLEKCYSSNCLKTHNRSQLKAFLSEKSIKKYPSVVRPILIKILLTL